MKLAADVLLFCLSASAGALADEPAAEADEKDVLEVELQRRVCVRSMAARSRWIFGER